MRGAIPAQKIILPVFLALRAFLFFKMLPRLLLSVRNPGLFFLFPFSAKGADHQSRNAAESRGRKFSNSAQIPLIPVVKRKFGVYNRKGTISSERYGSSDGHSAPGNRYEGAVQAVRTRERDRPDSRSDRYSRSGCREAGIPMEMA